MHPPMGSEDHESRLCSFELEHQRFQPMTKNDREVALLERELYLAQRLSELEKREQEVSRMLRNVDDKYDIKSDPLEGFGSIEVTGNGQFSMKQDMFRQIEISRQEEVARLIREKVVHENIQGIGSSASSAIQNLLPKSSDATHEIFESDSGEDIDDYQFERTASKQHGNDVFSQSLNMGNVDISLLPEEENLQEQHKIWESIKREREEEEKRFKKMKNVKVVKEQEEILRQIIERNKAEKEEEALTFKLIAEMTLNDQQQQTVHPKLKSSSAKSSKKPAVPQPLEVAAPTGAWGGGDWSKTRGNLKDERISRGARRKSDGWQAAPGRESGRFSGNQKSKAEQQFEVAEEAAISSECETAARKKDRGLPDSRLHDEKGPKAKNNKYRMQKTRKR